MTDVIDDVYAPGAWARVTDRCPVMAYAGLTGKIERATATTVWLRFLTGDERLDRNRNPVGLARDWLAPAKAPEGER